MSLRAGEVLINDSTPSDGLFNPMIDGEVKAHGLVPRDYASYPKEMFAPPNEIKLIPRSEWSARIKEKVATKSQVSDILLARKIPSMDQGPNGYCTTADTEVLTERGWVFWPDYNGADLLGTMNQQSGNLEFQLPSARQVFDHDGEVIYSTNSRIDFAVTPKHRMLVRKWDEANRTLAKDYTFVTADQIGWYAGLPHATRGFIGTEYKRLAVPGDREYDGDDFLALLGLVTSDGYAGGATNTKNWVSFASFREETRPLIAPLAARLGFHEKPSCRGVWIRYDAGSLAEWIRANCYNGQGLGAKNKRVPDLVKWASMRQIGHFLHYFDDRKRDGSQFYSVSKRMMDDLQELFLRIGKRTSISTRPARDVAYQGNIIHGGPSFYLTVSDTDRLSIERKHNIEADRYRGPVYCATVPNGTLVTRRNGSVLISGNCWGHSTVGCVQAIRALDNQPYIPLSAYMVCAIIKKGRNEGGWCGLSAKFLREVGVVPQSVWPQGDRNTSRDTPAVREAAAKFKVTEDWVDLTRDIYDQNLSFDIVASLLLSNIPVAGDFNWWSHSVMLCDVVEVESGSFGIRFRNSWGDSYGSLGFGVLQGSKANTNGAVALTVTGGVPKLAA